MLVVELGLEGNIPSFFYDDGHIVGLIVDPGQNHNYIPLLTVVLEIVAPSWAIFHIFVNQTSVSTWEKLIILD